MARYEEILQHKQVHVEFLAAALGDLLAVAVSRNDTSNDTL
jgi:hypothetical protein